MGEDKKGTVLEFKPRRFEDVWECGCGCQQFYLLASMRIECRSCGKLVESLFLTDQPDKEKP